MKSLVYYPFSSHARGSNEWRVIFFEVFLIISLFPYLCIIIYYDMAKNYDLFLRGYVGGADFDAGYVDYILDKYSDRQVSVLIDSLGGATNTALTICAAFANHGDVCVHFQGMSASAATIAALGAKKVTIEDSACYLVHKCSSEFFDWSVKNADQLDAYIKDLKACKEQLNKIDLHVASLYAKKCKKTTSEILQLMKVGGWLTPSEALEWGFVDEITESVSKKKKAISAFLADAMVSAGIPVPDSVTVLPGGSKESKSLMSLIEDKISNLFKTHNMEKNHTVATEGATPVSQNSGTYEIEALKAQLESEKEKHEEEISSLKSQIEELKKGPAAASAPVVESKKSAASDAPKSEVEEFMSTSDSARKLFNSIP